MSHLAHGRASRVRRRACRVVGMLCPILLLTACASSPPPAEPLPTVEAIRSDAVERADELIPDNPAAPHGVANFQSIVVPLDQPTDDAWALVDETAFPALTRGVWNANGLRIGIISRNRLDEFVKALPPAMSYGQQQLWGSDHPTPIHHTPRLRGRVAVDLTIPPASVREEEVTGGRLQLLARLIRDEAGRMVLDLVPHHHVPKLTLQPRSPLEKELDGRMFNELALRAHVPQGAVLVLGLYRPWPKPEEGQEPAAPIVPVGPESDGAAPVLGQSAAEAADQPETPAAPALEPPPLYNHLGRAFFANLRLGRSIQTVMLASVEPLDQSGPRFAPELPAEPPAGPPRP